MNLFSSFRWASLVAVLAAGGSLTAIAADSAMSPVLLPTVEEGCEAAPESEAEWLDALSDGSDDAARFGEPYLFKGFIHGGFEYGISKWEGDTDVINSSTKTHPPVEGVKAACFGGEGAPKRQFLSTTLVLPKNAGDIDLGLSRKIVAGDPDKQPNGTLKVQILHAGRTETIYTVDARYGASDWVRPRRLSLSKYMGKTVVLQLVATGLGYSETKILVDAMDIQIFPKQVF